MINIEKPVFFVGAPKCGSTSFHLLLENLEEFNLPLQKDTHYLWEEDFNLKEYASFFDKKNLNKRIAEVDQNLAIYPIAIENIVKYFINPYIIYVVRDPKRRFISAYKWLKKMALVETLDEGLEFYNRWLINQSDYKYNIEKIIKPIARGRSTIIIVEFEKLIKDQETLKTILSLIEVDISNYRNLKLPKVNVSSSPRNKYLVKAAKLIYSTMKYTSIGKIPKLKNSRLINKILFSNKDISLTEEELKAIESFESMFKEQQEYIKSLKFEKGVLCIK